ncbi:MAG TPA: hypothetical protein VIJ14_04080, partial [Rhabdochlamydiaceae bacterium]
QITRTVTKMEENARTQAVSWLSNAVLREGVNSFVTPLVVSGLLSVPGLVVEVVSIVTLTQNAGGYLETARTAAYVISYLKYANRLMWAMNAGKSIYKLHQSYTPEFTGEAMKLLRKSLTRRSDTTPENDFDPTKEIREYSVVVAKQCDLPRLIQQITNKTGLSGLIDSAPLKTLKRHAENCTADINAKSKTALGKYGLIDSPTVEEVSDDELSDEFSDCEGDMFYDCQDTFPPASNEPKSSVVTEDDIFYDCDDSVTFPLPTEALKSPLPIEDSKSAVVSDANAVAALVTDVFNIVTSPPVPTTSSDAAPMGIGPKKEADTNATPPPKPSWVQRITDTVSRIAGAISKFMRNISPSFRSRFSGIFQGNSSVKSRITTFLRSFFTAK